MRRDCCYANCPRPGTIHIGESGSRESAWIWHFPRNNMECRPRLLPRGCDWIQGVQPHLQTRALAVARNNRTQPHRFGQALQRGDVEHLRVEERDVLNPRLREREWFGGRLGSDRGFFFLATRRGTVCSSQFMSPKETFTIRAKRWANLSKSSRLALFQRLVSLRSRRMAGRRCIRLVLL